MLKQNLRMALLARRQALGTAEREQMDAVLTSKVLEWWDRHRVPSVGVYWPIRGEADLHPAYVELSKRGVQLALPVVVDNGLPLQFAKWTPGDNLIPGAMRVPIPTPPHILLTPDALLIPCLGFNLQRLRLGYGGGFYDRTLAQTPRPLAIGVAYQCLATDFVADQYDIAMDTIITEQDCR